MMLSPYGSIVLKALIQALSLFRLPRSSTHSTGYWLHFDIDERGCGASVDSVCTVLFGPRSSAEYLSHNYGY